jgi:hypothetical protein
MLRSLTLASVLFISLFAGPVQAQVCSGDVTLSSQADVNAFDCTEVTGNLTVEGDDINDLSPISSLNSVSGFLDIFLNPTLTSLGGLENLTSVGGLSVANNELLESLSGLENLASVDGFLVVGFNPELTSLAALESVTSVGDVLFISDNSELESLVGLENITSIAGRLDITGNPMLVSLAGLESLTYIGEGVSIIQFNSSLESVTGLGNLITVAGELRITNNEVLESLNGLMSVASIGGDLIISGNDALESLDGLEHIASVGDDLAVWFNDALNTCSCGLSGIITGDPAVFSGVEGEVNIRDNDPEGTCTSPEVVLATPCEPVANEDDSAAPQSLQLEVYPNPVARVATLQYALPEAGPVRLVVYDLLGREVAVLADGVQPVGRREAPLSGLAAGVYVVRLEAGEEVRTQRVTVLR